MIVIALAPVPQTTQVTTAPMVLTNDMVLAMLAALVPFVPVGALIIGFDGVNNQFVSGK